MGGSGGSGSGSVGGTGGAGGSGQGGGLYAEMTGITSSDNATFTNSTVSGNAAQGAAAGRGGDSGPSGFGGNGGNGGNGEGGGLYANTLISSQTTTLTNSTLAGNSVQGGASGAGGTAGAGNGTSGSAGSGQGLSLFHPSPFALHIANSILGNSLGAMNCAGSIGTIQDDGYNQDSGTSCGFSSANHSLSNTNPLLGPLANNGGPTQTMALLPGSPAINRIPPSGAHCPATDQRGVSRPQGPACDIGAYEFVPTTTTTLSASPNPGLLDQPVQLCATVKPTNNTATPSGSVSFQEGATTLGTATLNSSGKGCFTTSTLSLGDHHLTASYGGDGSFSPSTSAPLTVTIQVQGQDVAGSSSGGRRPSNLPQSQATGGQDPTANGAGQTRPQQPAARQSNGSAPWRLPMGLGLLLLLVGLGGLAGVFIHAGRRQPTPDVGAR